MTMTESTDHLYFLNLQQRKQQLRWGKGKKGHSLLSKIFEESSVLFKTKKNRFVSSKSGISAELDN